MYKHTFTFISAAQPVEITVDSHEPQLTIEQFDAIWTLMEDIHGKLGYNDRAGCPHHTWFRDGIEMGGG